MRSYLNNKWLLLLLGSLAVVALLYFSAVDATLTPEDRVYTRMIMQNYGDAYSDAAPTTFDEEIDLIYAVQKAVLKASDSGVDHIPKNHARNPKDLLLLKGGSCYDRSYVIEKMLRTYGFRTRHISAYAVGEGRSSLVALITPGISSHAVSEVLTKNGWLVVESNSPWLSLDSHNNPIAIEGVRRNAQENSITWNERYAAAMNGLLQKKFIYVYGLYSRHGKFYPPYNFIPDINWGEFVGGNMGRYFGESSRYLY